MLPRRRQAWTILRPPKWMASAFFSSISTSFGDWSDRRRRFGAGYESGAHQVGHHVNLHSFRVEPAFRMEEELEADRFAGYVLHRLGASEAMMPELIGTLPNPVRGSGFPSRLLRGTAMTDGWREPTE